MQRCFCRWVTIVAVMLVSFKCQTGEGQTPPTGFVAYKSWAGVQIFRNSSSSNFVTVVDLSQARMVNLTGRTRLATVNGKPNVTLFTKQSLTTFWQDATVLAGSTRSARLVINGAFFTEFADSIPETRLSHGAKVYGRVLTRGEDLANFNSILNVKYNPSTSMLQIAPYNDVDFSNAGWPDIIGGFNNTVDKDRQLLRQRTYLGINGRKLILLSSKGATQAVAEQTVKSFGASSFVMLDGGTSTGFIVDGVSVISPGRKIPHAIGILGPR